MTRRRSLLSGVALLLALAVSFEADARTLILTTSDNTGGANPWQIGMLFEALTKCSTDGERGGVVWKDMAEYNMAELRDQIYPGAASDKYDFRLMYVINPNAWSGTATSARACSLSLGVNRPRVPVVFPMISGNPDGFETSSACSCGGATGAQGGEGPRSITNAYASSPAGMEFPRRSIFFTKSNSAAGANITKVGWASRQNYTSVTGGTLLRADLSPSDSMWAWFRNTPIQSQRVGIANTAGFGCVMLVADDIIGNTGNRPDGPGILVALSMGAYLAPDEFRFPCYKVALDIDDGCKVWAPELSGAGGSATYAQVADLYAGLDTLIAQKIKFTVGVETDSMNVVESNGQTRLQNLLDHCPTGLCKVTVHNHRGQPTTTAQGDPAQRPSATSDADIWGFTGDRAAFTPVTAVDTTIYRLAKRSRDKLALAAGELRTSRAVMAMGEDYSSRALKTSTTAPIDSIAMAMWYAGYRVCRTGMGSATGKNYNGYTGGNNDVYSPNGYFAGSARVSIPYLPQFTAPLGPRYMNFIASQYPYGNTLDTAFADTAAQTSIIPYGLITNLISRNGGRATPYDQLGTPMWTGRTLILVSHIPNWRNGIGGPPTVNLQAGVPAGMIGRPSWVQVRKLQAIFQMCKWLATRNPKSNGQYLPDGPVQWVHGDDLTSPKDVQ